MIISKTQIFIVFIHTKIFNVNVFLIIIYIRILDQDLIFIKKFKNYKKLEKNNKKTKISFLFCSTSFFVLYSVTLIYNDFEFK